MSNKAEKLKIVYLIQSKDCDLQDINGSLISEISPLIPIKNDKILEFISNSAKSISIPLVFTRSDGKIFSVDQFQKFLKTRDNWGASVQIGNLKIQAGITPGMNQGFVIIEEIVPGAAQSWDIWVAPFLGESNFVEAWVSDVEYDFWQNASDPIEYESFGKKFSHLPLISNGLPPPLNQDIIDISKNPGRSIMRLGFIEAIGSTMWINKNLFELTKTNEDSIYIDNEFFEISNIDENNIKISSLVGKFCNEDTSNAQNLLRSIIYGNSANL